MNELYVRIEVLENTVRLLINELDEHRKQRVLLLAANRTPYKRQAIAPPEPCEICDGYGGISISGTGTGAVYPCPMCNS
tara:strand:- start:57 stop:293 length:237 start_codon:yes stop_codon:yes gene_type:complete